MIHGEAIFDITNGDDLATVMLSVPGLPGHDITPSFMLLSTTGSVRRYSTGHITNAPFDSQPAVSAQITITVTTKGGTSQGFPSYVF